MTISRVVCILMLCLLATSRVEAEKEPILAVFNIETEDVDITTDRIDRLGNYLANMLAANGYQVIPRSQLRSRLREQKKESYKTCYDQSCQIELGRELAAQKSLATQLIKLGNECKVTMTLYDLHRAASEAGTVVSGLCDEQSIVKSVELAVAQLVRKGDKMHTEEAGNVSGMGPGLKQPGTHLQWLRCAVGQKWNGASCVGSPKELSWHQSMNACPEGYRPPTLSEILNLLGGCSRKVRTGGTGYCLSCRKSSNCAMLFSDETGYFWTSESVMTDDTKAWRVFFDNGHVFSHSKKFKHGVYCIMK